MHFFKALGRGLSSLLLKFSLFTLAIVASLLMVFGAPKQLKASLKDSGIYNSIVDNAVDSAQKSYNQGNSIPLDRPEIRAAAKAAFPPEFLQTNSEQVIDSIYRWLGSNATNPDFKIDLGPAKQNFANSLGNYVVARAQSLPSCTLQQVRQLQFSSIDPYNVQCLPPGLNLTSIRNQVVNDVANNKDFLSNTVITADNFTAFPNQGSFASKDTLFTWSPFQSIFHWAKLVPYVLGGLAAISIVGLVFLYDERRRGLRAVGIISLGTGIFLFAGTWIYSYLFSRANRPGGAVSNIAAGNSFQQNIIVIIRSLSNALNHWLFIFCAIYVIIGVWILLTLKLMPGKKSPHATEEAVPHNTNPDAELPPPHSTNPEHETVAKQTPDDSFQAKKH